VSDHKALIERARQYSPFMVKERFGQELIRKLADALEASERRLAAAEAVCKQLMVTPSENFIDTPTMEALRQWNGLNNIG
jgi:hypothetical protein